MLIVKKLPKNTSTSANSIIKTNKKKTIRKVNLIRKEANSYDSKLYFFFLFKYHLYFTYI